MPIFVDGVEINGLFVDGVEQSNAFADGVEVFSGFDPQHLFDDFNRSVNGTPTTSHVMNTGHNWQVRSTPAPAIGTFLGEQGSYLNKPTGGDAQPIAQNISPIFNFEGADILPEAFYATIVGNFRSNDGLVTESASYTQIIVRPDLGGGDYHTVRFDHSPDPDVSTITAMVISNFNGVLESVNMQSIQPTSTARIEIFFDPTVGFQGRVTAGGLVVTSAIYPITTDVGGADQMRCYSQCHHFGNTKKETSISEFECQEYKPGAVPFP